MADDGGRDRLVLVAFATIAFLAGANGVGIRFSNRELDPLWGAALRFSLAAVVLLAILVGMRLELPRGRALAGALVFGLLNFAAAYALAYYALTELHAGFAQILLAVVPLATLLLAVAHGQERLRPAAVAGALLALAGVAFMSRGVVGGSASLIGVLAAAASALCIAEAAVLVRRFPRLHPVTMNAVAMTAGAVVLLTAAVLAGDSIELPSRAQTWAAVGYLVAAGSVAVFLLYVFVLGRWDASRAAYVFVLMPIVTVALSAWLDDEPVGLGLILGGALVLAGVYAGALRRPVPAEVSARPPG